MAILRAKEIRKTEGPELDKRLNELRLELAKERGNIHIGGTVTSPGRIREIRKTIARIHTIRGEKARGMKQALPVSARNSALNTTKTKINYPTSAEEEKLKK